MNQRLYVAYGSNLNLRQMAMRCPTAKPVGTGAIDDYELQFKGMPHGAFATIGEKAGAYVPVAVWSLRPKDEKELDSYEGYPSHYHKDDLTVLMDNGSQISAMVYIMNHKMQFGIPSQRYYNTVYEGYENCGLDVNILNEAVDKSIALYRDRQEKLIKNSIWNCNKFECEGQESASEPEEDDPMQMQL